MWFKSLVLWSGSARTQKNEGCKQTHAAFTNGKQANIHHMNSSSFLFSCITVRLTKQHGGLIQGRSFANSISCLINNDSRRLPYSSSSLIPRKCCSKLLFSKNPVLILYRPRHPCLLFGTVKYVHEASGDLCLIFRTPLLIGTRE